jgi:galactitol-specific phosphotransferase system IIB component
MDTKIKNLISQAQDRYLNAEDLAVFQSYVQSMPKRMSLYRLLRDREIEIMQTVADQLEAQLPKADITILETGVKNLLLVMRYCAMGMLLNDETFLKQRLLDWLEQVSSVYDLKSVNEALYKILNQVLSQELSSDQLSLLQPLITMAQITLIY